MGAVAATAAPLSDEHGQAILLGLGLSPNRALLSVLRAGYDRGVTAQAATQRGPQPSKSPAELMIEEIWLRACASGEEDTIRAVKKPSAGSRRLLISIAREGPAIGTNLAHRVGLSQSNVTAIYLPRLLRYGFVDRTERPDLGSPNGGGRNAQEWSLTEAGRELAKWCEEFEKENADG
jgi:hypothetical protein